MINADVGCILAFHRHIDNYGFKFLSLNKLRKRLHITIQSADYDAPDILSLQPVLDLFHIHSREHGEE